MSDRPSYVMAWVVIIEGIIITAMFVAATLGWFS
jgi:hypothetical protein